MNDVISDVPYVSKQGAPYIKASPGRSPTTTGKIERFHRSMRAEFLNGRAAFTNLQVAQQALNGWVEFYNTARPHQAIDMLTPAERFTANPSAAPMAAPAPAGHDERTGSDWVSRLVTTNGVVCVSWQQVSLGRYYAGSRCDVHVDGDLLRFFIGDVLVKTAARTSTGEVRNKRAFPHQRTGLKHNNECQGSTEPDPSRINRR
jgi:Integrase core domain